MSSTPTAMSAASILTLAKDPPQDQRAREELYEAAKTLMFAVEGWQDLFHRAMFGVSWQYRERWDRDLQY